jgi:YHS domain-containing protein
MKKAIFLSLLLMFVSFALFAALPELKPQTTCPISGEKIDKKAYADYEGQRVYFCCNGCKAKFEKDPEKFMEKFEKDGVLLENVQKADPVCGMALTEKKIYRDYKGRRVYFCSESCAKTFDKDQKAALDKLGK